MKYLGEFLCVMTSPDGHLYIRVSNALAKKAPYVVQGQPYGEALLALSLLQHISPSERVRETVNRLAKQMTTLRPGAPPTGPRTIEALATYYRLQRVERIGEVAVKLGKVLADQQLTEQKTPFPDCAGGFQEPDRPPDTYATALAVSAMTSAYEVGKLMDRPVAEFSAPVRSAARFLMNMQNRPENGFFLRHREVFLGGFRKSPEDLSLRLGNIAEATRALISAAAVTAETVPPEALEEPRIEPAD